LRKIADGKTLDIVFEITDGGADEPALSRAELDALLEAGVVVRAFQIGETSPDERRRFNEVWNDGRKEPLGRIVGKDVAALVPAVAAALKEQLRGVRL